VYSTLLELATEARVTAVSRGITDDLSFISATVTTSDLEGKGRETTCYP